MTNEKRTKIIATIGPAIESEEMIEKAISAGVNVFRFNMKHNSAEWHISLIKRVQKVADGMGVKVGILIDLQGPEIRIETKDGHDIHVKSGDAIRFVHAFDSQNDLPQIRIAHSLVLEELKPGDTFTIDDGAHELQVTEKPSKLEFMAVISEGAVLKTRKGLNLSQKDIDLPSLIDEDLDKLDIASQAKVDFIGLSFVRSKKDIETLRHEMKKRNIEAKIISKVESLKGVDNIDEIIEHTDAVMIARGDLGVEIPIERLPLFQKLAINKCRAAAKPVIVATQMLESMITNPMPTRAEVADVANAVFDGTDCVMLSAESATGKYPIKALSYMQRICKHNEPFFIDYLAENKNDQTRLIASSVMGVLKSPLGATIAKILVFTETGYSARVISSMRPQIPVVAVCADIKVVEQLSMSYGVTATHAKFPEGVFNEPRKIIGDLVAKGLLQEGEKLIIVHGHRWNDPGKTNGMFITEV